MGGGWRLLNPTAGMARGAVSGAKRRQRMTVSGVLVHSFRPAFASLRREGHIAARCPYPLGAVTGDVNHSPVMF